MTLAPAPRDTRARIEAAALKLFAHRGVDGAAMRDIAAEVGVTEGALYRHFPSKEALARALFRSRYGALAEGVEAIRAGRTDFSGRLDEIVAFFAQSFDADPDGFAYVLVSQHEHLRELAADAPDNAVEAIGRVFAEAMAAGEIPRADLALTTAMALGLMVQPAIFRIYGRLAAPPSAHAPVIAGAIRRAVGATA
ncbi:TetR/AcrR family transcriptional regulator [Chenggangzhangella methanolivorans]|uniref:TetR/AcrR family transcriptional regulator n=1 Tax=Chenggangzhangella methanolivorans TaxID=1437009 RepID=A0A9E6RIB6_9HYPH|nr:TetR/AcrR family transcriptional regulator [Chenggangzhangella methanolivorans]QZO01537.1 TetR/AcrR family transcriptional regulator [Chenggangzhangella methanolivorans]